MAKKAIQRSDLMDLQLQELKPSPTNPRKTFDLVKLEELARSVAEKGLIEPIVVRPRREPPWKGPEKYEIVAGERRYRAAGIAGVETVLCIVRELSDIEVLEVQTIENLQRDDLHPLEEADGYARLMKEAGYDVDKIAAKVSMSTKYVYDRVKLLQLVPTAKMLFLEDEITAGHAILLARLSPSDQERIIGNGEAGNRWKVDSLFQFEEGHHLNLDLDDDRGPRKAISVRELEALIDRTVRFRPDEVDLPNLFPETKEALETAAEEDLKVVSITREYRAPDEARDPKERTYGYQAWKRADGELEEIQSWERKKAKPSKACEYSVMGVVVAGPGRGEAFRVCVQKKKCKVHWGAEMKEAEKRKNGSRPRPGSPSGQDSYQELQRKQEEGRKRAEAEGARWEKAAPALLEALAEKLRAYPPLELVGLVVERLKRYGSKLPTQLERGETSDDALRYLAFLALATSVTDRWNMAQLAPKALKPFGINAKKIVDQVAPPPEVIRRGPKRPKAKKKPKAQLVQDARRVLEAHFGGKL